MWDALQKLIELSWTLGRILEYEDKFEPWTSHFKSFIERVRGVTMRSRSLEYSIQFAFNYRGMSIDVDLLVSPYWDSYEVCLFGHKSHEGTIV